MTDISDFDKNLAVTHSLHGYDLAFYDAGKTPFSLYGLLSGDTFLRMPTNIAETVSPGVVELHKNTSGGRVRFRTDSVCVAIRTSMPDKCLMPHMPFLGSSGFDLYVMEAEQWRYCGSFVPPVDRISGYESMIDFGSRKERECLIHFPLYDNVTRLMVGVERNAKIMAGARYRGEKPIVFYGSSITQGGCASRPGNSYTNMISRRLNRDHINLGFSGNAMGELQMARYIASLPMCLLVLDYDHNSGVEQLRNNHEQFFLEVRRRNPELPVIMASRTDIPRTAEEKEEYRMRREIVKNTYEHAIARGDRKVAFIDGSLIFRGAECLGVPDDTCTVDGIHPTDLGFACMAKVFGDMIEQMLPVEPISFAF